MSSKPNISGFFVTKIAKDNPDKITDPGEAAAAGAAVASGTLLGGVGPFLTQLGLRQFTTADEWAGNKAKGLDYINHYDFPKPESVLPGGSKIKERPYKDRILNLFDVSLSRATPDDIIKIPEFSKNLESFAKSKDTIDSMLAKYNLPEKGVTVTLTKGPMSRVVGPHYYPQGKEIVLPWTNKELALHEVGHAAHLTKPGAQTFSHIRKAIHGGMSMAVPMAYIAGNEFQKLFPGTVDDKIIDFVQRHSPAILASTYAAAELYPEVQATTRAVHHVYKTEGAAAARQVLKKLIPPLLSYVVPMVPAMVGLSLAKKYFFEAKDKMEKQSGLGDIARKATGKVYGFMEDAFGPIRDIARESSGMVSQIGRQAGELFNKPLGEFASTLYEASKKNIASPEFIQGAVYSGVPAAAMAYVYHNTQLGKMYREKQRTIKSKTSEEESLRQDLERLEDKKHHGSMAFPAIVGISAAISGGFLSKMFGDIAKAL